MQPPSHLKRERRGRTIQPQGLGPGDHRLGNVKGAPALGASHRRVHSGRISRRFVNVQMPAVTGLEVEGVEADGVKRPGQDEIELAD
jgi:hypothetical protein